MFSLKRNKFKEKVKKAEELKILSKKQQQQQQNNNNKKVHCYNYATMINVSRAWLVLRWVTAWEHHVL